jgi:hypothetical protein
MTGDGRTPAGPGGAGGFDPARLRAAARDARRLELQAARLHGAPHDLARLHAEPGPGFLALPAEAPLAACR